MPVPGGTTLKSLNTPWPQRRNLYRSLLRSYSSSTFCPNESTRAERVGDHRVVDDELGRRERVDLVRVAAEGDDCLAHGGEVDDAGHAGEVLHDDPGRGVLDLGVRLSLRIPGAERLDLGLGHVLAVLGAEQILQQHLEAERQLLVAGDLVDSEYFVGLRTHREGVFRTVAVGCRHCAVSLADITV